MSIIQFYNRRTQSLETEVIYGERYLRWIYHTSLGKLSLWSLVKRKIFSQWYGKRMNHPKSAAKVPHFIKNYNLDPSEYLKQPEEFKHFNDFFYRKLKADARPIDNDPAHLVFPADGRHLAFQKLSEATHIFAKGQSFDLASLFQDKKLAERYYSGSLLISRLCPVDYHRFHFPASGIPSPVKLINGYLASVSPIALRQNLSILWQNKRTLTHLATESWGKIICMEIGATCVGGIAQTFKPHHSVLKGEEKGYFRFGGSMTMLFFEPGTIQFAEDLQKYSKEGIELYARMGEFAGTSLLAQKI